MRLRDFISKDLIFIIHDTAKKAEFLQHLAGLVKENLPDIDEGVLYERLSAREESVSTGIGHGVAVPHTFIEGVQQIHCIVIQIPEGIDFEALDASPVHLLFLLLRPPDQQGNHLRLMARVARLLYNEQFIYHLAKAKTTEEIYSLITEEDSHHV